MKHAALATAIAFVGCATATSQTSETQDEPDITVELPIVLGGGIEFTKRAPSVPPAILHHYGIPLESNPSSDALPPDPTTEARMPAKVDLSSGAPAVADQGDTESCQAWAAGYAAMGWWAHHAGLSNAQFAPMYLYSQYDHGSCGSGGYVQQALAILQQQGVDTKSDYEPMQQALDCTTTPDTAERANAARFKISGYVAEDLSQGRQQAIMAALAGGRPALLGITVYSELENATASHYVIGPPVAGDIALGGHEVTAFKYDATGVWIMNQWGTGWGHAGWSILSWDFINGSFDNVANLVDVYTISGLANLSCSDSNTECAAWAETSQCQENPDYMLTSCCASCANGKIAYETYSFATQVDPTSCLDVYRDGSANYTALDEFTCNGTRAQAFTVINAGNANVNLYHSASGKCVDARTGGTANGTPIDIYDCNGTPAQRFQVKTNADGSVTFVNPTSGRCLDVTGRNSTNLTGIQLWDCNGTIAQRWQPKS